MRPPHEHDGNLDTNDNHRSRNTDKSQKDRAAVLAFNSEYDDQLEVVTFFDLIRLSHFEPSLARAVRQSGEARNAANRLSTDDGLHIRLAVLPQTRPPYCP